MYLQPDSIAPQIKQFSFLWSDVPPQEEVPERKRRITVRRFRGNWSEGLLLPLSDFPELSKASEGDDVAAILGVKHYEEPEPGPSRTPRTRPQHRPMAFVGSIQVLGVVQVGVQLINCTAITPSRRRTLPLRTTWKGTRSTPTRLPMERKWWSQRKFMAAMRGTCSTVRRCMSVPRTCGSPRSLLAYGAGH